MTDKEIKKSDISLKEEEVLKFWNEKQIFKKSLEKDSPKGEFIFYEGPPTANGKPGIHHIEARSFKDVITRYKTMRGFHVRRKGGWDTHGLPVELQVEKQLGLKSKKEIESYGIEEFNKKCKESVWEYVDLWSKFTDRIGYWVDQENPYVTYHNSYIESVWNILKTVDSKKLLYKDYKVLPWCPRCGTALSSHELAQGYQDDKDLSVTAKFKVKGEYNTFILAWTTTPWTLPGNVALAVGKDIQYSKLLANCDIPEFQLNKGDTIIIAKDRQVVLNEVLQKNKEYSFTVVEEIKGENLVGWEYQPLYDYLLDSIQTFNLPGKDNAFKVYDADFVTTEDGTGVVHTAVMYGQDDFVLGTKIGLPKYHLVLDDGKFKKIQPHQDGRESNMKFLSGRFVKDEEVAVDVIKDLAHRGLLFKKEKYEHSYPHCWRCKTPLIYYARDSWYIKMSDLRDKLVTENENINWEPSYIKEGRFGEWLREIKDWAISRERYWGTPLPVWMDKDGNHRVIGGIDDLKKYTKKSGNKYFVMRHGEAVFNALHVKDPQGDPENHLTENGIKEVKSQSEKLKKEQIDFIFHSPFIRTKETAEIVKSELGLDGNSIIEDERLHEYNESDFSFVRERVGQFIFEIEKKYSNKNILIISHGCPIWVLQSIASLKTEEEFEEKQMLNTAEAEELSFVPFAHNEKYELDLHRPFIDNIELIDEKGESLTRVKEVMDVWFDSGAMPFAQDNYPFSTNEIAFPADYISEAIDQTRGWFYTLHAIGVLMDRGNAFKNVICLGHILDAQGKKMSKSIGNVVDPWEMMDKYGVDSLRLWMYSVNQPGDSKNFDEKTVDEIVKKVFNPLENILALYELYKDESVYAGRESQNILDRWIISKLDELVKLGTERMDNFRVFEAVRSIRDFVSDFSTWYVRRSRERLKSLNKEEKEKALATTKYVLVNLMKYMAPFAPFFSDRVYQRLKEENDPESVHLADWPETGVVDTELLETMTKVRDVVTRALELRQKAGHKVRQPLASLRIKNKELGIKNSLDFLEIIKDEVNVKIIETNENIEGDIWLDIQVTEELKKEGIARDIIRGIQDARKTEGLLPSQNIKLRVHCEEEVKKVIKIFEEMIKIPTQVEEISYSDKKQTHVIEIEGYKVSISIVK